MQDSSRPVVTGYPAHNGYPPPQQGAAYPYPAPPPQAVPYYNQQPYPYRASYSRTFIRTFITTMILVFFILGVSTFILWLVLRPRVPEFRVVTLSVSNLSTGSNSSSSLTGTWNVDISVNNPNKKLSVVYDSARSFLYYKSGFISETRIPPFKQAKQNQTTIDASFSAVNTYVDRSVVNDINGDRARGIVTFNMLLEARAQFRSGGWRLRSRWVRVLCEDLAVGLSSNNSGTGKLTGGTRECRVRL